VFHNAADRRMSKDNCMSCASCHADGGDDGMAWDFTQRGELHWTANFDEVQDFEHDIRNEFGGTGFLTKAGFSATGDPLSTPQAGRNAQSDELAAYLTFSLALSQKKETTCRQFTSPYPVAIGSFRVSSSTRLAWPPSLGFASNACGSWSRCP